jgi:carboxyl-terminal processing protease
MKTESGAHIHWNHLPTSTGIRSERRETQLNLAMQRPKYKDNPYSEPDSIVGRVAADSLGEVKVSLFPGTIGIDFAKQVDQVFKVKVPDVRRLVLDLRGNPGGGIGGLHLMSYLTPSKLPIGYSVDRQAMEEGFDKSSLPKFDHIPKSKMEIPLLFLRLFGEKSILLQTEGLGSKSFHGRIVVLVNEHTTGAAEMVGQFVQENGLGTVAGTRTPGRLVTRSAFKIGKGYRLVVPIAAYVSWKGNRIEGEGITPDVTVDWSYRDALRGVDSQLSEAIQLARAL